MEERRRRVHSPGRGTIRLHPNTLLVVRRIQPASEGSGCGSAKGDEAGTWQQGGGTTTKGCGCEDLNLLQRRRRPTDTGRGLLTCVGWRGFHASPPPHAHTPMCPPQRAPRRTFGALLIDFAVGKQVAGVQGAHLGAVPRKGQAGVDVAAGTAKATGLGLVIAAIGTSGLGVAADHTRRAADCKGGCGMKTGGGRAQCQRKQQCSCNSNSNSTPFTLQRAAGHRPGPSLRARLRLAATDRITRYMLCTNFGRKRLSQWGRGGGGAGPTSAQRQPPGPCTAGGAACVGNHTHPGCMRRPWRPPWCWFAAGCKQRGSCPRHRTMSCRFGALCFARCGWWGWWDCTRRPCLCPPGKQRQAGSARARMHVIAFSQWCNITLRIHCVAVRVHMQAHKDGVVPCGGGSKHKVLQRRMLQPTTPHVPSDAAQDHIMALLSNAI
jgi:hypothetical protein